MAFSSADITAAEQTGFTNDKPMMLVQQASNPTDAHWTTTGSHTGTDVTLASEPATRAYDSIGSIVTSTTGVASTSPKYFNFYFATAISFDSLLILGHNFNSIGITDVTLEIADNADFDENVREIAKYTIDGAVDNRILFTHLNTTATTITEAGGGSTAGSDKTLTLTATATLRQGDKIDPDDTVGTIPADTYIESITDSTHLEMTKAATGTAGSLTIPFTQYDYTSGGTAQRYSSAQYVRLRIVHAGSEDPEFAECLLGYRYQLQRNPNLPWDNKREYSETVDSTALSGLTRRYVQFRGQAKRSFTYPVWDSDEITVIENWWDSIEDGTKPFVYIETPSSSPQAMMMIMDNPELKFKVTGPVQRVLSFNMTEQPLYLARE